MKLFPADAEQKLGFHIVRRRLAELTSSEVGEERIEQMGFDYGATLVAELLERTVELQQALQVDDPIPVTPLPDVRDALRRAQPRDAVLDAPELGEIGLLCGTHRRATGYFRTRKERYESMADLFGRLDPLDELEGHLQRIIDPRGVVRDDASPELQRLTRRIAEVQDQLRGALMRALRAAVKDGFATEDQPTVRGGRAVIPVRAEARRKVRGFVHDVSGTGQTVYIEPAAVLDLNNEVRELELERAREIRRLLQEATGHVRARLAEVRGALDVMAELDELRARARLSNELEALPPELNQEGRLRIVNGRNPALALHFSLERRVGDRGEEEAGRTVVPMSIDLSDDIRTVLVTGPNAGGKTVAMKASGLFALMVAAGLPVPAAPGTSVALFDHLFADIGDQQNIEQDLSTFTSHLANLRRILAEATDRSIVLIDEAGTGTDPAEGGALAQAVLEILTERGVRTIATTHHGTLKAFAHETPHVVNASMQFDHETLSPTYVFREGVPGSSYAFEIADRVGLDPDVLKRARELAGEQKTALEDLIATLDARSHDLERRLDEAAGEARDAERARKKFEQRDEDLRERRQELIEEANREAERVLSGANARIERTIREIKEAGAEKEATRQARERLDAVRERVSTRARKKKARPKGAAPSASGPIEVGDSVRLEPAGTVGEVIEMGEGEAVVALGQMRVRTKLDRLVKVSSRKPQRVDVASPRSTGESPTLGVARRIDVRGRRVNEVVPEIEQAVDRALVAGLAEIEVLHGTGTGALRHTIREYLAGRPDVAEAEDAPWDAGGPGVTVIRLA